MAERGHRFQSRAVGLAFISMPVCIPEIHTRRFAEIRMRILPPGVIHSCRAASVPTGGEDFGAGQTHLQYIEEAQTVRILVIEDDTSTADYIARGLTQEGHVAEVTRNGRDGLVRAVSESFDVIVTDRMLPGPDGLSIVRALRAAAIATPVLVLTALGEVERRVEGLDAGADDYLAKPFAFSELHARIRALSRRPAPTAAPQTELLVGGLRMDLLRRIVLRGTRTIDLLPTEWRLLEYLMRHPGQVLTRTMLLERVWDFAFDPTTNVVDVHVSRLRRKLELPGEPPLIRTVRGAGYVLDTVF